MLWKARNYEKQLSSSSLIAERATIQFSTKSNDILGGSTLLSGTHLDAFTFTLRCDHTCPRPPLNVISVVRSCGFSGHACCQGWHCTPQPCSKPCSLLRLLWQPSKPCSRPCSLLTLMWQRSKLCSSLALTSVSVLHCLYICLCSHVFCFGSWFVSTLSYHCHFPLFTMIKLTSFEYCSNLGCYLNKHLCSHRIHTKRYAVLM